MDLKRGGSQLLTTNACLLMLDFLLHMYMLVYSVLAPSECSHGQSRHHQRQGAKNARPRTRQCKVLEDLIKLHSNIVVSFFVVVTLMYLTEGICGVQRNHVIDVDDNCI